MIVRPFHFLSRAAPLEMTEVPTARTSPHASRHEGRAATSVSHRHALCPKKRFVHAVPTTPMTFSDYRSKDGKLPVMSVIIPPRSMEPIRMVAGRLGAQAARQRSVASQRFNRRCGRRLGSSMIPHRYIPIRKNAVVTTPWLGRLARAFFSIQTARAGRPSHGIRISAEAGCTWTGFSQTASMTSADFAVPSLIRLCFKRVLPRQLPPTRMKITDIKATTVTVPLEAPLRHGNGCH